MKELCGRRDFKTVLGYGNWSSRKHLDLAKGEQILRAKTLLVKIPSKFCHLKVNTEST